jgi:uncharacterized membrane protein YphA (DoxX/SURF4 family)
MSEIVLTSADPSRDQLRSECWGLASRIAFRFTFLYFGLYCLLTQIFGGLLPIPTVEIPDPGTLPPFRQIVFWTAEHVFRYKQPPIYSDSGSGDKVFDWVLTFCLLVLALAGTSVWSVIDRRRANYDSLYKWFRVFLRFALAGQLFVYGLAKIIPMQMSFPSLTQLLERYGDFSPMGVLWSSVGASPAYERFVGSAELLAGLLLVIPATSMVGALICLIDMIEVFALNMTYDVPVKLFSFHMVLMAAFLLIPERSRLVRFCFLDCPVERSTKRRLFEDRRANQIATAAQILFGLMLLGSGVEGTRENWFKYGGGAPTSALYGIWNVDEMSVDGVVRSPLLTDYGRWRRVVFEFPQWTMFERMDDSFAGFGTNVDAKRGTLVLTKNDDPKWKGQFAVHREGPDRMTLDGKMGQQTIRMRLSLVDRSKFLLVSRGFHWIQDYPFNR